MTTELDRLPTALLALPQESEWVEFKHNNADPEEIGEYVSARANSAALPGDRAGPPPQQNVTCSYYHQACAQVASEQAQGIERKLRIGTTWEFQQCEPGRSVEYLSCN